MGANEIKNDSAFRVSSPLSKQTSPHLDDKSPRRNSDQADNEDSGTNLDADNDSDTKPQAPMQKRRRVTRACDECRRKKIKCDGKQPCTHCTVYSYDCTYDQPSNRRRNPAPQYIEALEQRLQKAESILRIVLPGVDFDDPKYDARNKEQILETHKVAQSRIAQQGQQHEDDTQMRSMVDRTGTLELDDSGHYQYSGQSSGYHFMRKFRAQFGDEFIPIPKGYENHNLTNVQESPKSLYSSPFEPGMSPSNELPPKHVAIQLCRNAIDDCCALQRPLHRPTFFKRLEGVYNTDPEHYSNEHTRFLPLLYTAMAVGCLFGRIDDEESELKSKGYRHAIEQGYQYFNTAKSMLDVTDCRDLLAVQTVMFMILFLQGTAKLATCYSYVGVALRACCRLGMHRKISGQFNVIEAEERKRIFWQIRKLDIYTGAMLGLPRMLSDDDIDQELPLEASDEQISEHYIAPIPQDAFPLIRASNAHTRLLKILQKVVRYVYPLKPSPGGAAVGEYMISHSLIRELERDLQTWMDELPMQLRPSENPDIELSRVQQLLRMSYAYVQMMIYRPFLHYVSKACQTARTDKRSFACAAACVSVARNIVHITSEMKKRGLLMGAYWFVMYTTYFAILTLLYFVLENPESTTSKDILKDAVEGRDTLRTLATRSLAADRATMSLEGLFEALPGKLNERRSSIKTMPNTARKRPPPANEPSFFGASSATSSFGQAAMGTPDVSMATPARARTMPQEYLKNAVKRTSVPEPTSAPSQPFPFTPEMSYTNVATPSDSLGYGSSHTTTPALDPLDFGTSALVQGQLPDLKSVMFPGDNPFAYPNQPMSTLDTMPNMPLGNDQSSVVDQYNTPGSMHAQQQRFPLDFDQQPFQRVFHHHGEQMPQQFFNVNHMSGEPDQMQGQQQHHSNNLQVTSMQDEGDYWSHAPAKGTFRTGLTPGGPGVNLNLDDIFGNAQGWNNMPMNLGTPGKRQQQAQQGQNMQWTGHGNQNWQ